MLTANFCVECGEPLARKGRRGWPAHRRCDQCVQRSGILGSAQPLIIIAIIATIAFAFGRYLRPSPPPLIIERAANSPLADAAINRVEASRSAKPDGKPNSEFNSTVATADEAVYICGARTQKGTPCHRRVHAAGERCFQHKGMAAMVPLEKLKVN